MMILRFSFRAALLSALRTLGWAGILWGLALQTCFAGWENLAETHFSHLDVDNGLPHGVATALAQDKNGFLWVGTQGGLARWDGYRFRSFQADAQKENALPDDLVQTLYVDPRGVLWVGSMNGGLSRFDAKQEHFSTIGASKLGLSNPSVYTLLDDGKQGLWIGTHGGLNHLGADGKTVRRWLHDERESKSLPDNHVSALLRDKDGQLWVGTARGLARMEADQFHLQTLQTGQEAQPDVRALWQAPSGQIWVGARQGAYRFDPATGKVDNLAVLLAQPTLAKAMIVSIMAVGRDEIWLASANLGIFAVSLTTMSVRHITHDAATPSSLSDNAVLAMLQDQSGLLWLASLRGISRHDPRHQGILNLVGNANRAGHIGDRDVWSVKVAKDGKIWLGLGSNGVDILAPKGGVLQSLRPDPSQASRSLPQNQVLSFAEVGKSMLIGTNRGLYLHEQGSNQVELMPLPPRKPTRSIKTLLAQDDKIWLGSSDGVWSIPITNGVVQRDSMAQQANFSDLLSDQRITSLSLDQQKRLWVGTWNGVNIVELGSGKVEKIMADINRNDGLAHGFITSILCDKAGRIWLGTSGGGVQLWRGKNAKGQTQFQHFDVSHGLPNSIVNQILQDAHGNIWVSTDGGLARISAAIGDKDNFIVQAWRQADGVRFGTYWANSGAVTQNGELLFGAAGGLTVLQPERIAHWRFQPRLVVTDIQVSGKATLSNFLNLEAHDKIRSPIVVSPHGNSLAVEFSALDFSAPEKNRYAYWLEGFDRNWISIEANRRLAAYTNLPPGNYKLHLRGSNRNGLAADNELLIPVTVLPDWYQTWWFRMVLIAAGALAVLAFVQVRTKYLRLQKQALEAEISARTAKIQTQQAELLSTNLELQKANQELASSANTLRELGDIGREITGNLEFDAMFAALHRHLRKLLDAPAMSIYRADFERGLLHFAFGREDDTILPASSLSLDSPTSLSVRCARERREVFVELEEGHINPSAIPNTRNMLTLLFGPLIVDNRLLGVMSIQSDKVRAYGERERMIFRTLCAYAAIALENGAAYSRLQEAQDMLVAQEKLAALGALVAGVSHELNTPLGNSMMMASSLEDNIEVLITKLHSDRLHRNDLEDYLNDAQEAAQVLMRNLRNAAQLVNSFKQVAVDRTSVQRRVFDLRLTSLEVIATLLNQIKSQGLELECEIPPDIVLDSYPGPYGQVLAHLISNALMHAFEGRIGGKMVLSAQRKEAGRVLITFCDDGIGIRDADLKHIFDPFFTTKMGQGGKGLGLSVCYNIVTSILGGQIFVSSNRAKGDGGTCFSLDLPLVAQA